MAVVLDISSDEESGLNELAKTFDYDWIKEFLGESDEESDDSDDVVVIGEVKPEQKSKSSKPTVKDVDDDCVVLDGDPEDRVTSVNETETESDELLVVGEKGQIACRDYPHARHLCAEFPFSSTPHEKHCDQCHCYVCDSLAPCLKWGTGISDNDHCHASEKVEMWKTQRKNFKLGTSAPITASTNYSTPHVAHHQQNQVPERGTMVWSPTSMLQSQATLRSCSSLNDTSENQSSVPGIMHAGSSIDSILQNQDSRPDTNAIPSHSSTPNFTVPDSINHGRCQESASTLARTRYQPHMVPRQMLCERNISIRRERGHGLSSLGPQFLCSHTLSDRLSSLGGSVTVNLDSSGYSNHVNPAEQYDLSSAATELSNDRNPNGYVWSITNSSSYSHPSSMQPNVNCVSANTMPVESQAYEPAGNNAPSSHATCMSSNQHGNGHQNEYGSQNNAHYDFTVFGSSWTENRSQSNEPLIESCDLQSSGSINQRHWQPANMKESNTQFGGSANLGDVVKFEEWVLEKKSASVVADGAAPSELNFPPPDEGFFTFDFDVSWNV
ncbi:hypothetical protein L6164_004766 [Bauhinia variegata]|uniref:Uncharacterized protein n=1 Tax=Bauhinia variegata TaxID=167791 RepID=A0ACB9PPC6_BAUVA|nr:hypothetical protein L6164_004766 [Bauhinia variegata]